MTTSYLACHRIPDLVPLAIAPDVIGFGTGIKDDDVECADSDQYGVTTSVYEDLFIFHRRMWTRIRTLGSVICTVDVRRDNRRSLDEPERLHYDQRLSDGKVCAYMLYTDALTVRLATAPAFLEHQPTWMGCV